MASKRKSPTKLKAPTRKKSRAYIYFAKLLERQTKRDESRKQWREQIKYAACEVALNHVIDEYADMGAECDELRDDNLMLINKLEAK